MAHMGLNPTIVDEPSNPENDLMNFLVLITDQDRHSKRIELSCRQYHVL